jgi:hypothetical protein
MHSPTQCFQNTKAYFASYERKMFMKSSPGQRSRHWGFGLSCSRRPQHCVRRHRFRTGVWNWRIGQGILKGKYHCDVDLLFDWFGISCMTTDNFFFCKTSQTGGQWYNDTSPFSIPWIGEIQGVGVKCTSSVWDFWKGNLPFKCRQLYRNLYLMKSMDKKCGSFISISW